MREERFDVLHVRREEDLLQQTRANITCELVGHLSEVGYMFAFGTSLVSVGSLGLRAGVGYQRESHEKKRKRVRKVQSGMHEESEGGETTTAVGEKEGERASVEDGMRRVVTNSFDERDSERTDEESCGV